VLENRRLLSVQVHVAQYISDGYETQNSDTFQNSDDPTPISHDLTLEDVGSFANSSVNSSISSPSDEGQIQGEFSFANNCGYQQGSPGDNVYTNTSWILQDSVDEHRDFTLNYNIISSYQNFTVVLTYPDSHGNTQEMDLNPGTGTVTLKNVGGYIEISEISDITSAGTEDESDQGDFNWTFTPTPWIQATALDWDGEGGARFSYQVVGIDLTEPATVELAWASGTTPDTIIGGSVFTQDSETAAGTYGPIDVAGATIGLPPAGANNLLLVVDPGNVVSPADPSKVASLAVSSDATTVSVTSSANPSIYEQSVTITASVADTSNSMYTPIGAIQFSIDGEPDGLPVPLELGGTATLTASDLSVGSHTISAAYIPTVVGFSPNSGALTQVVTAAETATEAGSEPSSSVYGQPVTIGAFVGTTSTDTPANPTGSVQLYVDGNAFGDPVPVGSDGLAGIKNVILPAGTHQITAAYLPDSLDFGSSASESPAILVVAPAPTSTTIESDPSPSVYGQPVTLTAQVINTSDPSSGSTAVPTGKVQFQVDGNPLSVPAALDSGGVAQIATEILPAGTHQITAAYVPDTANFAASDSEAPATQVVQPAPTLTTIESTPSPSVYGQTVTFTAQVENASERSTGSLAVPEGSVQFSIDGTPYGAAVSLDSFGAAMTTDGALLPGTYKITAAFIPNSNFLASQSETPAPETVIAKSSTTLTTTPNPSFHGELVTLTATTTVVPGGSSTALSLGTVTFWDGSNILGTSALTSGSARFSTRLLATGLHSLTATYSGATDVAPSSSDAVSQTVNPAQTLTTVQFSVNPSVFGQQVQLTAAVTVLPPGAGVPTGSVTFFDGTKELGTRLLSGGLSRLAVSSLTAGVHAITAAYGGDVNDSPSSSPVASLVVRRASTAVTLTSSVPASVFGQPVAFTASVSARSPGAGVPTGLVTFYDGKTKLGTATVQYGSATISLANLAVGAHSIAAVYGGDSNFLGNNSRGLRQSVTQDATQTGVVAQPRPVVLGRPLTLIATVRPVAPGAGTPTGMVTFKDGMTAIKTVSLRGGVATLTTSTLAAGVHSVTAVYGGDTNDHASVSSTLSVTVQSPTATAVSSSGSPSLPGQPVTLFATVKATVRGWGAPTGVVTFTDGTTVLGTAVLSKGKASLSVTKLAAGSHGIVAVYAGDALDAPSTSAPFVQKVQAATSVSLVSSSSPVNYGIPITFTATVVALPSGAWPWVPTGTITFFDGTSALGTVALSSGAATLTIPRLAHGTHKITAFYDGDATDQPDTSAALKQTVA